MSRAPRSIWTAAPARWCEAGQGQRYDLLEGQHSCGSWGGCTALHQTGTEVLRACLTEGFLRGERATQGKTNTPSWGIMTDDAWSCAPRALRPPATEVPVCRTEAMIGWP